jgi:hypothetical protein
MKKVINVPASLSLMPLRDYQALIKIITDNKDDETLMQKLIVQHYTRYSFDEVNLMKAEDFNTIVTNVINCLNEKPGHTMVFQHKGKGFGFIPKLDDISTGEYIDLDSYLNDVQSWHYAMAVLYRPVTKVKKYGWFQKKTMAYAIEEYETSTKYSDVMQDMPASIAVGASLFFWTLNKQLLTASLTCIQKELKKVKAPSQKENLQKILDGIHQFMQQQEDSSSSSIL